MNPQSYSFLIILKNENSQQVKEISEATQLFIEQHAHDDPKLLALKRLKFPAVDFQFALQQIEGRKKGLEKFPSLAKNPKFLYPKMLSVEQASSEMTARYKTNLLAGKKVLDITGGLGIDDFFIAEKASSVTYVEKNPELAELVEHNRQVLQIENLTVFCADGIDFLQNETTHFDCIYLDPARRSHVQKVFLLQDCTPNILECLDLLFVRTNLVLLKASPMLDISKALLDMQIVSEVHVVGVKNECKELLFLLSRNISQKILFKCINLFPDKAAEVFDFFAEDEQNAQVVYAEDIEKYVYEPNVCILKAGAFKLLSQRFALQKLSASSHFYTSSKLIENFPGRIFEIEAVFSMNKENVKLHFPNKRANVIVRNFPLSAKEVSKKFGLTSHETQYLLLSTMQNGKKVALKGERIK